MTTEQLIIGGYAVVAFIFLGLILSEAAKRDATVTWKHILVPVIWPVWSIWYICVLIKDRLQ